MLRFDANHVPVCEGYSLRMQARHGVTQRRGSLPRDACVWVAYDPALTSQLMAPYTSLVAITISRHHRMLTSKVAFAFAGIVVLLVPFEQAWAQENQPLSQSDNSPLKIDSASGESMPNDSSSRDQDSQQPLRIGPMLGVGLPNLLSFGVLLIFERYFGAGINFGLIPTVRLSYYGQATLAYHEYDAFLRAFPFAGGFFVGMGVGYETVSGTFHGQMDTSAYSNLVPPGYQIPNPLVYASSGHVRTLILTPQLGYLYTSDIGFSLGLDVGVQVPVTSSQIAFNGQLTMPPNTPKQLVDDVNSQLRYPADTRVRNTLQTIGRTPLPTLNVRVGWLF